MATRQRVPREVREREMLAAARRVFSRQGFHEASMDEIAELSGISKPMLYAYFGSKEGLYLAAIRRSGEGIMRAIAEAADESLPADEQLWHGLLAFFEFVVEHPEGWAVLHRQAAAEGGEPGREVAGMRARIVGLVATLIGEVASTKGGKLDALEVEALAQALVGAGESLANWWSDHPQQTAEDLASRLMNLAWMGLGDLYEGRRWKAGA
jgi:AcrR family transcriptional regulator